MMHEKNVEDTEMFINLLHPLPKVCVFIHKIHSLYYQKMSAEGKIAYCPALVVKSSKYT